MENLNEKIYSKITAIIMVAITMIITIFCVIIMLDVKDIKEGIRDLKALDQMRYERLYIADEFDKAIKNGVVNIK